MQKELAELTQGDVSITNFFTQLKVLWDQIQNLNPFPICTCGKGICGVNHRFTKLQVKESVMKFLMGLTDSFSQEEVQRNGSSGSHARVESTALATKGPNFIPNINSRYGSKHPQGKKRPQGTHCGKLGHTANKCYKLHEFPLGFKFKRKNPMAHQVFATNQPQESTCVLIQTQFQSQLSFIPD